MPAASTRRSQRSSGATRRSAAQAPAKAIPAVEPRGARRKRETRQRLLRAAMNLMAEQGVGGVAINEITEAADVGFGSFYNHFASKEAIYAELVTEVVERFGEALDRLSEQLHDPAEKIAASVRFTLLRARQDRVWGRFLVRTSLAGDNTHSGLGRFLFRDLKTGLARSRFKADDVAMTYVALGGTALGALTAEVRDDRGAFGADSKDIPERTASMLLRMLGLSAKEADTIARRPLPEITLPPSHL
ncbi:MAG TPA: TetR/AcrR family transcriptional regulator [Steroidobacteraceae bacterium]